MANKKKDIDKKISQGGFVQHPDSGDRLPDVVMQMPHLFYLDTYQWTQAVSSAKQWDFTRRRQLYDMYESIMLDSHLLGTMRQRRIAISQFPVEFVNEDGEVDEEVMTQIKAPWFRDFLKSLLDPWAYGFAAYQFWKDEEGFIQFTSIDKRHIQPFTKEVLKLSSDMSGVPLDNWENTLFLGDPSDIGALATAIPWVLWKRQSVSDWAQFAQIFGMPIREYTYSAGDEQTRQELINDALAQGANAVYIHPSDSDMKLIESGNKSGSAELYKTFRDTCNEEISLLILGNTLTSTSATHGTQALGTVHEEQQDMISLDDRGYVLDVLNYYMSDIFANLRINTEGGEFRYKEDKKTDPSTQINIVTQLHSLGLPMDDDYLYETFNITKPKNYNEQKKAQEKLKQALQKSLQNPKKEEDDEKKLTNIQKRALGFFGQAHKTVGDANTDW